MRLFPFLLLTLAISLFRSVDASAVGPRRGLTIKRMRKLGVSDDVLKLMPSWTALSRHGKHFKFERITFATDKDGIVHRLRQVITCSHSSSDLNYGHVLTRNICKREVEMQKWILTTNNSGGKDAASE